MSATNIYKRIKLEHIRVARATRQRTGEIDVSDLLPSIRERGVLQPILVTGSDEAGYDLIFGERRYTASKALGYADIPCRIAKKDLSETELQIIELEENFRRQDLPWQDHIRAVERVHGLYCQQNSDHTQLQTAEKLNLAPGVISQYLRVAKALDDPKIAAAPGWNAAYNMLSRKDERKLGDLMSDLLDGATAIVDRKPPAVAVAAQQVGQPIGPGAAPASARVAVQPESHVKTSHRDIQNESFLLWAPNYRGQTFNLIHCDFPYGINFNAGPQSGRDKWNTYNDSPDIYWELIGCLCKHLDSLMAHSGHLMFWLSADIEMMAKTLEAFRQQAPSLAFWPKPLIWHKSDNVGILSDPKRGPRHVYEALLVASRDDRLIVRAVSDTYSAPTDKAHHPSTKPEPVLRHFMSMFVDEHTRLFDPTCGSGSALRAAESLGAKTVLGLEIDPEHCNNARSALRQFRSLKAAAKP